MKRIFLALMLLTFFAYPAFAELEVQVDGTVVGGGFATQVNFTGPVSGSGSTSLKTIVISPATEAVQLPISEMLISGTLYNITNSTAPGFEEENNLAAVVWADGETTPVQVTFRVPADYSSGGVFNIFADDTLIDATPTQIDFQVYVNTAASGFWDSAVTNQTPVSLTRTATPNLVVLTPATDFDSLAAGDYVTLEIWRNDTAPANGASDLEVYHCEFIYSN